MGFSSPKMPDVPPPQAPPPVPTRDAAVERSQEYDSGLRKKGRAMFLMGSLMSSAGRDAFAKKASARGMTTKAALNEFLGQ